ncbi:MAG: ATP-binding protein, partial [Nitrososphaeraceae archaeon]
MSDTNTARKFLISVPLEEKIGTEQTGRIKVGSQIIAQLSKGIYSTPEMAIKELISNAFDAGADEVVIDTKTVPNTISIRDDGHGMDYTDFDENFVYISRSPKVESSGYTEKYNRPIIGRLGIGFIAVSTLCNTMIISSTKKNSKTKFVATLDFSKFKRKDRKFSDFNEISDFTLTNYEKGPDEKEDSYTYIELRDLEPPFQDVLLNKTEEG